MQDKKEKTKTKRGGVQAQKGGDWDDVDEDIDVGMGSYMMTDEEKEQIAREERLIALADTNTGGGVIGGVEGVQRGAGGTFKVKCLNTTHTTHTTHTTIYVSHARCATRRGRHLSRTAEYAGRETGWLGCVR